MSEPLVVAEELEREYRIGPEPVRVLRGVSLTVNAGESVAIIGASGVGKSTLLHLLGTLDRPTGGRVIFDGEDVSTRTDAALARLRRTEVGFIFQFYNLLGEMTALENAMLPALLQRASVPEARERAAAALHEVGLGDRQGHRPGELSGGEQQRVAIARALVSRPTVLFADEPTGNLDSATGSEILTLMRDSVDSYGQTTVMVTHEPRAAAIADRILFLADGQIVSDVAGATQAEILETLNEIAAA
jgi:putative ABC transport system ATP-binding protein